MRPSLRRVGRAQSPVVVVDDFTGNPNAIVGLAAALAPFPAQSGTYYPGLRQLIPPGSTADAYVERLLEIAGQFIGGAFEIDSFNLIEASFSMVTAPADSLDPAQRAPHFDSTDPNYLAIIHYLSETPGTAFYRQRATGIEIVDAANMRAFIDTAKEVAMTAHGYINGSDAHYEEIGRVEGVRDRLAIYRGSMLHSGLIPPDMAFSTDPRAGRLTANLFVIGRPNR